MQMVFQLVIFFINFYEFLLCIFYFNWSIIYKNKRFSIPIVLKKNLHPPIFSPSNCLFCNIKIIYVIHLNFILIYHLRYGRTLIFFQMAILSYQHQLLNDPFFLIWNVTFIYTALILNCHIICIHFLNYLFYWGTAMNT